MSIELTCTVCGAINAFSEAQAGRMGQCGKCGTPLYIPRAEELPPKPLPSLALRGLKALPLKAALGLILLAGVGTVLWLIVLRPGAADAQEIMELSFARPGVHTGAIMHPQEKNRFLMRPAQDGTLLIEVEPGGDSKLDPQVAVFETGDKKDPLVPKHGKTSRLLVFTITSGKKYQVEVAGRNDSVGPYKATFTLAGEVKMAAAGPTVMDGALAEADDENLFLFKAPLTGTMVIQADALDEHKLDAHLCVWDVARKELVRNAAAVEERAGQILFAVQADKEYFLKVAGFDKSTGKYKLNFLSVSKPGKNHDTALEVRLSRKGSGKQSWRIERAGEEHMFRFAAPLAGWITVDLQTPNSRLDGNLYLYDSQKQTPAMEWLSMRRRFYVEAGKIYYAKVGAYTTPLAGKESTGAYTLIFTTVAAPADDYGNDFATAHEVRLDSAGGASLPGKIETELDWDFFRFQTALRGQMTVEVNTDAGNLDALAWAYDTMRLAPLGIRGNGSRLVSFAMEPGRTYYVKVVPSSSPLGGRQKTGSYKLSLRTEKLTPSKTTEVFLTSGYARIDSQLTLDDGKDTVQTSSYRKIYTLKMQAGKTYQIDMESTVVDPYLRLEDASNFQLAKDDDSGGNLNARITFSCKFSGTYRIIATTLPGFRQPTGAFTLKILEVLPTVVQADDYGNDFATAHEVFWTPAGSAGLSGRIEPAGDVDFFKFQAKEKGWVTAALSRPGLSQLDYQLEAYSGNRRSLDRDIAGPGRLVFRSEPGKVYYLKVSAWPFPLKGLSSTGSYTLAIRQEKTLPEYALAWFRDAAGGGNILAMHFLGWFYENGFGVNKDYFEAMAWYKKAADKGQAASMNNIGWLYQNGLGVARDYGKAKDWYDKAGQKGSFMGMENLGWLYEKGLGVAQDYAEARRWYQKAADLGQLSAMNKIGWLHQNGLGVKKAYAEALRWYQKAADKGDTLSLINIGLLYQKGLGVAADTNEAMRWFKKAADAGDKLGMTCVGLGYQNGWGAARDYLEAMAWFKKAAAEGDSLGTYQIAWLYQNGWGVAKDYPQALDWYKKAAKLGDAQAPNQIGWFYENGWAVAKDYTQALTWYQKAADAGNAPGMFNVGWFYEKGLGVVPDVEEAVRWYRRAAALGNQEAQKALTRLGRN